MPNNTVNMADELLNKELEGLLSADDATIELMLASGHLDGIVGGLFNNDTVRRQVEEFRANGLSKDEVWAQLQEYQDSINDLLAMMHEAEDENSPRMRMVGKLLSPGVEFLRAVYEKYLQEDLIIEVCACHPDAKDPVYAHDTDGGADVWATEDVTIAPGGTAQIPTGLQALIPPGWMLSVRPRGGNSFKTKMRIANAPGTVDANYTDEIFILCDNIGTEPLTIKKGTRPAQLVLEKVYRAKFVRVDKIDRDKINRANENGVQSLSSTGE